MSESSRCVLELKRDDTSLDAVFSKLVTGCWTSEGDRERVVGVNSIDFIGGLEDTVFHIHIENNLFVVESDCPWELELICDDLKDLFVNPALHPVVK
ncbi:hypothetical protein [Mesobacillus zeae]|uniref:Uncharacterized protein n=1 Tax=Mesobacillus zeae TaxID=1917180 RepID=A0A398B6S5_9BACI|nr:hypothetical protein [Mesobacillus zeae]RID85517.1 hypothetical protein D1970_08050 [Mesobacillus zeae]